MKHKVFGRKLNRDVKERKSLFKSLVNSLIISGRITTTLPKAKAVRGLIDRLVNKAKEGSLGGRRQVEGFLSRKETVRRLVDVIAPKFKNRTSGFTRIIRTEDRIGDGASQAIMEWVELIEEPKVKEIKEKTFKKSAEKAKVLPKKTK